MSSAAAAPPALFSGWVHKQGGRIKTWKQRWLVLQPTELLYYVDEDKAGQAPRGTVQISTIEVRHLSISAAIARFEALYHQRRANAPRGD